jgi:hypothetical protein
MPTSVEPTVARVPDRWSRPTDYFGQNATSVGVWNVLGA